MKIDASTSNKHTNIELFRDLVTKLPQLGQHIREMWQ